MENVRTYRTPPLYRLEVAEGLHEGALQKLEQTLTDLLVAGWELHGPPMMTMLGGDLAVIVQALKRPLEEIHDRQENTGRKGAASPSEWHEPDWKKNRGKTRGEV